MHTTRYQTLQYFREVHPARSIDFMGNRWEYIACGKGAETVLFLHGLAGAHDIWWQLISAWENRYRSIAVTYPPVKDLVGLAAGIIAILDAEGVDEANLVGSSLGGYLAQYLMTSYPERIKRAVFSNTYAQPEPLAVKYRFVGSILPYAPEWLAMSVMRLSFRFIIYPSSGRSELTLEYLTEQVSGKMTKAQLLNRYYNVIETFSLPDTSQLDIPILIVESDNDPLIEPPWRDTLKATYPTARVVTLHNAGHFPYLIMADHYREILEEFFRDGEQLNPQAIPLTVQH